MRRERWFVALLGAVAAVRIVVFASALPFFHINDEHQQVDAIVRYARGELPGPRTSTLDPRVAMWAVRWGTFEYLEADPPPPYLQREGADMQSPRVREAFRLYSGVPSSEFESPPVFYALAGTWFAVADAAGMPDPWLLYWTRWLSAAGLAGTVLLAWWLLRRDYADEPLVRLGVPALVAFFPQDVFFSASVDAFAPLVGAVAFAAVLRVARRGAASDARLAAAGLALAAAFLAKYTNAVFAVLGAAAAALRLRRGEGGAGLAWMAAAAALPVAAWFARNWVVLGDLTGTSRKVANLEWFPRALGDYPHHPLFTPAGAAHFATELSTLFWRGELSWHGQVMSHAPLDFLYAGTSLAFLALTAWALRRPGTVPERRLVEGMAVAAVVGAGGILAVLSVWLDFADWGTPTHDQPFFVHGRLVTGVLVPFCLVWVRGLQLASARLPRGAAAGLLVAWIGLVCASEWILTAPLFRSAWNLYHLG